MGREIRMVPPNWQHPQKTEYNPWKRQTETTYQPLFDETYEAACDRWKKDFRAFYRRKDQLEHGEFWDCDSMPPDQKYYRTYSDEEATWFCAYETVSEGTPVSPPFATKEELADYLAENGDFWDQIRRKEGTSTMNCDPWGKDAAYKFVFGSGYAPSIIIQGGQVMRGTDLPQANSDKV